MGKQLLGLILDRGAARKIALAGGREEIFADARPTFSPILGREEEKKNPAKKPPPPPPLFSFRHKRSKEKEEETLLSSICLFFELFSSFLLLP